MSNRAQLPEPVLRAREIHRANVRRIPKVSYAVDLHMIPATAKARQIAERVRAGLARRLK